MRNGYCPCPPGHGDCGMLCMPNSCTRATSGPDDTARLRMIVNTIGPIAGCFCPDNEEQSEKIALEWCHRFHNQKNAGQQMADTIKNFLKQHPDSPHYLAFRIALHEWENTRE